MEQFISLFIIIPFLGLIVNGLISQREEVKLAQVSFATMGLQFISVFVFTIIWLIQGSEVMYKKQLTLLRLHDLEIYLDFKFDWVTAVFLAVGAFIAFLITTYSRNYLHREAGFKRFFTTILFFYLGYNLIVLSGNLTTIFVGWEIAGISSFLLIAYYRNRYIPVKNAVKIFSIYRLGDIALMLALWLSHHIWHENVSLNIFSDTSAVLEHIGLYPGLSIGFSLCIFVAAAIKSAQFPFSAWLSRAMEGPTPSSAIFYSSLAVHLGVLVLLRTYDFWIHVPYMQVVIIASGTFSFLIASVTARIQPSIKGQIAYLVVAQVGLMSIEVALGWHVIALIHFASHAMLRSYQLLISPSIVSYMIRKQFFEFKLIKRTKLHPILNNLSNSIYILSLNEWYLDAVIHHIVWAPFKKLGNLLNFIPRIVLLVAGYIILVISIGACFVLDRGPEVVLTNYIVHTLAVLAFIYVLRIFTEKEKLLFAWLKIGIFHGLTLCVMYLNGLSLYETSFYAGGVTLSFIIGHLVMNKIRKAENIISLSAYQGHCYEYPIIEFWFLVSCLGLMGFPITSAFVGNELLLGTASSHQPILLATMLLSILVNGLAMVRMYARIFLGPHVKTYHTSARKSS